MGASYTYALAMFQELWSLEYRLFFATFRNGRQMHWNHYITNHRSPRRLLNDMWQRPVPVSDGSAPATPLWLHVRFLWVKIMVCLYYYLNEWMTKWTHTLHHKITTLSNLLISYWESLELKIRWKQKESVKPRYSLSYSRAYASIIEIYYVIATKYDEIRLFRLDGQQMKK